MRGRVETRIDEEDCRLPLTRLVDEKMRVTVYVGEGKNRKKKSGTIERWSLSRLEASWSRTSTLHPLS